MKLIQRNIPKLKLPDDKADHIWWDDDLPGFGARLRVDGKPSWVVQYKAGGATRRMKIGLLAELDAGQARDAAAAVLAKVRLGGDPQADKRQERALNAEKLGGAIEIYLAARERTRGEAGNRDRTLDELKRYLQDPHGVYWRPLHKLPVTVVSRRDIARQRAIIEVNSGRVAAKQAKSSITAFFSWAVQQGLLESSPAIGIEDTRTPSRDRVLSDAELADVWRACADDDYGKVARLLLLTGCRREEIGALQWSEIDLDNDTITLPASRTKNNRAHIIPLSGAAREIIQAICPRAGTAHLFGRTGFTNWHQGKRKLDRRIAEGRGEALAPWRLHDLRRSAATGMAELGVQPHVVEAALNHVSGAKAGVAGTYNRASYDREKRTALALWSDHILAFAERRPSTVTPLLRA
jgi:integrase